MFRVFRSERYDRKFNKLNRFDQRQVSNFEQALKLEPFSGKPLSYKFFREKKFRNKRILFLVYEEQECIFLITITNKKLQQHEIDLIKANLEIYKEEIQKRIGEL